MLGRHGKEYVARGKRVSITGVPRQYENAPPPWDRHRSLGAGLLQGPRRGRFLTSEVPLYIIVPASAPP